METDWDITGVRKNSRHDDIGDISEEMLLEYDVTIRALSQISEQFLNLLSEIDIVRIIFHIIKPLVYFIE